MTTQTKNVTKTATPKKATTAKKPVAKKAVAPKTPIVPVPKPFSKKPVNILSLEFAETSWDKKHKLGHKQAVKSQAGAQLCEIVSMALVLTKYKQKLISPLGNEVNLAEIIEKGTKKTSKAFTEYKRYYVEVLDKMIRQDESETKEVQVYPQFENGLQILSFCKYLKDEGYKIIE